MRVVVAADHAGYPLKQLLASVLAGGGHEVVDLGTDNPDLPDDYPDFAQALGEAIAAGKGTRGVLICGSGVGASIAANKIVGVRAGLCHDHYSAKQGVEHDDMNVIVFGSRVIGTETAKDLLAAFLGATFAGEERHARRLAKVNALDRARLAPETP